MATMSRVDAASKITNGEPARPDVSVGPSDPSAERIWRTLVESSTDVICEVHEGVVTYISPNTERVSGLCPGEFVGRAFIELIHPEDIPDLARFQAPGWTGAIEACFRVANASGEWQWREARGVRVLDGDGAHRSVLVLRNVNDRLKTEQSLYHMQRQATALLTAIPDLMFRIGRDGTCLDFKAERAEDLYVPPERIIGNNIRDLLPADLVERIFVTIERAFYEGAVQTLDYSLPKHNGLRDYEARIALGGDNDVVVIARDVTERKLAERAREESERRYREIVEQARDVVYVHDLEGNLIEVNRAGLELFGFTAEEVRGMNLANVIDPAYLHLAVDNMRRAMSGETMLKNLEFLAHAKDGSPRWLEISPSPVVRDGEIIGFQGIARDITERRASDERLRFQAQLLDVVSQAVTMINRDGEITFWNRCAEDLFGWSADEVMNRNALGFNMPENRDAAAEAMRRVGAGENWTGEFVVRSRTGRSFPALVIAAPIRDADGAITGGVCVSTDISELKRTEQYARNAEERTLILRERHRIAQELHDSVAQYFFSIGLAANAVLATEDSTTEELRRRVTHIRALSGEGGQEIRRAIHALGDDTLPDVDAVIQALFEQLRADGTEGFYTRLGPKEPLSEPLHRELLSIARECLFNARKHANARRVFVTLSTDGRGATLTIADDGTGDAARIEQVVQRGGGYGLRSMRTRLRSLGGDVTWENNDGSGIRVIAVLPHLEAT
jgi:PAS domain S-box-containing protein